MALGEMVGVFLMVNDQLSCRNAMDAILPRAFLASGSGTPETVSVDPCEPIPWLERILHAVDPAGAIVSDSSPSRHRVSQTAPRRSACDGESERESATDDHVV
jgi:hypothetical protein